MACKFHQQKKERLGGKDLGKKHFKFWLRLLAELKVHGEAFDIVNSGGSLSIYYDTPKGKYALCMNKNPLLKEEGVGV